MSEELRPPAQRASGPEGGDNRMIDDINTIAPNGDDNGDEEEKKEGEEEKSSE